MRPFRDEERCTRMPTTKGSRDGMFSFTNLISCHLGNTLFDGKGLCLEFSGYLFVLSNEGTYLR